MLSVNGRPLSARYPGGQGGPIKGNGCIPSAQVATSPKDTNRVTLGIGGGGWICRSLGSLAYPEGSSLHTTTAPTRLWRVQEEFITRTFPFPGSRKMGMSLSSKFTQSCDSLNKSISSQLGSANLSGLSRYQAGYTWPSVHSQ